MLSLPLSHSWPLFNKGSLFTSRFTMITISPQQLQRLSMPELGTDDWVLSCRAFLCSHVNWSIFDNICHPERVIISPTAASSNSTIEPTISTQPVMAVAPTDSLLTKFNQPITFFTIACLSVSVLALSTAWHNRRVVPSRPVLRKGERLPHPEIVISDEGYSSSGEQATKDSTLEDTGLQSTSTLFTRTALLLASCTELLQSVNRIELTEEHQLVAMSSLSAELPMSIATLCQIQQLLGIYYDTFNDQHGLRSCYETVLSGLALVVSSLDGELANLSNCDCSQKFPRSNSTSYRQFEQLMQQLREHRQSLTFVLESAQKMSDSTSPTSSSSLAVLSSDSKARTPGTDLKGFMDCPPDFDELPEYSPPADGQPFAPDVKAPQTGAVEIDSQPVHLKPNSGTIVTSADLFATISENDVDELKSLLSTEFDPNMPHGKLQRTALHEAARLNRAACAKALIQNAALVDVDDSKGDTPLHLASWEGAVDVGSVLIAADAEIDRLSGRDGYSPLWCAITGRNIDMARLLLRHDARISLKSPADAEPLHQAAITGQSAMCQLLLDRGANVDCADREKNTPLHYAATIGDSRTAKILVNEGADVNAKQERGLTPLHWACHKGHDEVTRFLLDSKADINARSETFATALHCAAARGHLGCVKILTRKGIDLKVVTTGWDNATGTAEEIAVLKGFASVAAFLADFKGKRR